MPEDFAGTGAGGSFSFNQSGGGGGGVFGRMFGGNRASTVSAGLKFDIPGLQQFKRELDNITGSVNKLRDAFKSMSGVTSELGRVNTELSKMAAALKGGSGGGSVSGGQQGNVASFTGASSGGGGGLGGMLKGLMGGGGGGMSAGASAGWGAVGAAFGSVVQAGAGRVDQIKASTAGFDPIASRLGIYTGTGPQQWARNLGNASPGSLPYYGNSAADFAQAQLSLASTGAVAGAGGLQAGARGEAAGASIQMLQQLRPGMSASEGAANYASFGSNIPGQKRAARIFGKSALMGAQSEQTYFASIMRTLQGRRTGKYKGVPFTKDELLTLRAPGSLIYSYFSLLGWNDDQIDTFFSWAMANAASTSAGLGSFTGTEAQAEAARGGESLTREKQKTSTQQAITDASAAAATYKGQLRGESVDQAMLRVQQTMEQHLSGILSLMASGGKLTSKGGLGSKLLGALPGLAIAAVGAVTGQPEIALPGLAMAAGGFAQSDPMDMGDALTGVNPDVRKRVEAMMQANPNLKIASGYRTGRQQQALYASGQTGAQPGKSQHGRGRAVDIGPRSQYGWIQNNAKKFGLDHAAKYGEPWHVQVAGTMQAGDPMSEADQRAQWEGGAKAFHNQWVTQQLSLLYARRAAAIAGGATPASSTSAGVSAASATPSGGTGSLTPNASGQIGYRDFFSQVLSGLGAPVTEQNLAKLAGMARGEGNHGDFNPLNFVEGPGTNFNKVGVKNYPDPATGVSQTIKLLSQKNTAGMLSTLKQGSYDDFFQAVQGFYGSWGGRLPNISEKNAVEYLNGSIEGHVGDPVPSRGGGGSMSVVGGHTFNNTFHITVQGGGSDVDSLTRKIASKLEEQMARIAQTTRR